MKGFNILAIFLGLSTQIAAQSTLPLCANSCISILTTTSSCISTDVYCLCQSEAATSSTTFTCCLAAYCSAADKTSALLYVRNLCLSVGVTLPSAAGTCPGTTTSAANGATTSGTGGASSAATTSHATSTTANTSSPTSAVTGTANTNSPGTTTAGADTTSTSNANSPATTSSSSGGGLSSGAAAGIGVGATVVVLGALAAAFLLYRKKKKARAASGSGGADVSPSQPGMGELSDAGVAAAAIAKPPPGPGRAEMGANTAMAAEKKDPILMVAPGHTEEMNHVQQPQYQQQPYQHELEQPYGQMNQNPSVQVSPELSGAEVAELESRRRAAELQGLSVGRGGYELPGSDVMTPRAELEALRNVARYELG